MSLTVSSALYGYRLGVLGAPARIAQAAAPLLFGLLIDRLGSATLIFSSALSVSGLIALCLVTISNSEATDTPK
jgi:hypothetical protein